ncbi:MAG: UDP-N-acetylglucosamine 2-epimerase (non-hydrolyzing) [Acidobacteria bacterium]|nr:MAG: UDP-N-acetylglucosamine 2-epimerase (non-hydrolyzing) [Acidobacteriota bacterium]
MTKKRILSVVGARPNFMKIAPILLELDRRYGHFDSKLVHTGQHYDQAMSDVFFHELGMKQPDYNLGVGSASHALQTAEIMKRFEEVCRLEKPDLVVVGGDVNSTLACSLTAVKMLIPVAHVEAGLRSFDRTMPEEINRLVTDSISDLLFTTEISGNCHLKAEGIPQEKIHLVGNTMIDSLVRFSAELSRNGGRPRVNALADAGFYLATIHRPANVDEPEQLAKVLDILLSASDGLPVLFVAHPRTRERLRQFGRDERFVEIQGEIGEVRRGLVYLLPPLSYLDFLYTMSRATAVLTDSGGIQEETTFLGIPCLTLRENTERPITVEVGSNEIVGLDRKRILACLRSISAGRWKKTAVPPLWDGKAAGRIVDILESW